LNNRPRSSAPAVSGLKLPVLMIEDDYSTSTIGQLRTRIQAFLEMIM